MKRFLRYPLLLKLLVIQALAISWGLIILLGVYQFTSRAQLESAQSRMKEQVVPILASRQEQWRAWQYMGLQSAISEEANQLGLEYPIQSVEVKRRNQLSSSDLRAGIVLPDKSEAPDDYVVVASLDMTQIENAKHGRTNVLFAIGLIALLFLGLILFSGRYIYRRVYLPIITLNKILSGLDAREKSDFQSIPAVGEMRDFLNTLSETLTAHIEANQRLAHEAAFGGVAKSVAHDIRSPLSALNMLLAVSSEMPEAHKDLMRASVARINKIADDLLLRSKGSPSAESIDSKRSESISDLLVDMINEKKLEMSSRSDLVIELESSEKARDVRALVDSSSLARVVSNVLNNAVEAEAKRITMKLDCPDEELILSVQDNGKGIPKPVLERLSKESFSFGKDGGHGLGLSSLKTFASDNDAKFNLTSEFGVGTRIELRFRVSECQSSDVFVG